jgi:nucleoid-associated protein YgaU
MATSCSSKPSPFQRPARTIWDAIKAVDPTFADLKHDIEAKSGAQDYTVQPGDNLSKISKHFYGDANKYQVIAKANNLDDPDKIKVW